MNYRSVLRFRLAAAACCFTTCVALAQDFMQVPRIYTRSPVIFRDLFEHARCATVTGILLGDSQETAPGGAGAVYIPRLQFEFWDRYGNAPQTPLAPMAASYGTAPVYADWLLRVANASPGVTASRIASSSLPAGASAGATSTTNGSNVNNNQWYGQLVLLQNNAADTHPAAALAGTTSYFQLGSQVYLDVFAATNPVSGELRIQASYASTPAPSYFTPVLATFTTSMGLEDPTPSIRSQQVGPLPYSPQGFLQVAISGTDPSKLTDVIGVRFVNRANPRGWGLTSLSKGGYSIEDALTRHADSGPVFQALNPDILFISFGANDSGRSVTADQFEAWLNQLIAFVRSSTRPDLPVVILGDPYRRGLTGPQQEQFDRYPRAAYQIALQDPFVCAVNSRRITSSVGWRQDNWIPYLSDSVHFTPYGAITKSRLEARELFDAFLPAPHCKVHTRDVPCGTADPCYGSSKHFSMPE